MAENELKKLKEDINDLRKQKIIQMAKLKQKEDKITELSKKIRSLAVNASQTSSEAVIERMKELEDELNTSRKNNKSLRAENVSLKRQLEEANKSKEVILKEAASEGPIQAVSTSGAVGEESKILKSEIAKKDQIIARLSEELEMIDSGQMTSGGSSYMAERKLNAKIRELKSSVEIAKKSEASMKQRLMEMQRKLSQQEYDSSW